MRRNLPAPDFTKRFLELFMRRPFAVFLRIFIIVYAIEKQEFTYIVLLVLAFTLWLLESIALYIDPELYNSKLISLANMFFFIFAIALAVTHFTPVIMDSIRMITAYSSTL